MRKYNTHCLRGIGYCVSIIQKQAMIRLADFEGIKPRLQQPLGEKPIYYGALERNGAFVFTCLAPSEFSCQNGSVKPVEQP